MKIERTVTIDGTEYGIVISDETEALLAAKAAGRAIIGLLEAEEECVIQEAMDSVGARCCQKREERDLSAASYLVESLDDVDELLVEQVVRRYLGLPWIIAETDRLIIREFQVEDAELVLREETDTEADRIFYDSELLAEYIRCQYGFYEYGIWALIEKASGRLVGKAGLSNPESTEVEAEDQVVLELGYHIFQPYRRQGYAVEACQAILQYAGEQWDDCRIYAKIDASNEASICVAKACGFTPPDQACNGALRYSYPCERY